MEIQDIDFRDGHNYYALFEDCYEYGLIDDSDIENSAIVGVWPIDNHEARSFFESFMPGKTIPDIAETLVEVMIEKEF